MTKALDAAVRSLRALKSWEHASSRGAMQSLDWRPCRAVAKALGYKRHPLTIHVAGSKGKGTVCALVGAALERAGFRVGVVTSPHAHHFGERLRIGMRPAGDALAPHLQRAVDVILDARRRNDAVLGAATQFDAFVAAALKASQKCDAVVVECGLGGRRDSTNFLAADVAALTSVEVEHAEVLGATTYAIAREKAAIASPRGVLVVSGSLDAAAPGWREQVNDALVLGAGGASRSIVYALLGCGVANVHVVNRTAAKSDVGEKCERVHAVAAARRIIDRHFTVDDFVPNADCLPELFPL